MGDERLTLLAAALTHVASCANDDNRTCRSCWQVRHTSLISCARLSCLRRVVYFFILTSFFNKFSLVMSCEFSTMSLASGGFAPRSHRGSTPGPRWGTSVSQTPCSASPLWKSWIRHCSYYLNLQSVLFQLLFFSFSSSCVWQCSTVKWSQSYKTYCSLSETLCLLCYQRLYFDKVLLVYCASTDEFIQRLC